MKMSTLIPELPSIMERLKQLKNQIFIVSSSDGRATGRYYLSEDGELCKEFEEPSHRKFSTQKVTKTVKGREAFYSYVLAMLLRENNESEIRVCSYTKSRDNEALDNYGVFRKKMMREIKDYFSIIYNGGILDTSEAKILFWDMVSAKLDILIGKREMENASIIPPNELDRK